MILRTSWTLNSLLKHCILFSPTEFLFSNLKWETCFPCLILKFTTESQLLKTYHALEGWIPFHWWVDKLSIATSSMTRSCSKELICKAKKTLEVHIIHGGYKILDKILGNKWETSSSESNKIVYLVPRRAFLKICILKKNPPPIIYNHTYIFPPPHNYKNVLIFLFRLSGKAWKRHSNTYNK